MPDRSTIFALSSGRPPAAIAVVRVSGPHAGVALEKLIGRLPEPRKAALARVRDPQSGRVMELRTTQPGVQLYNGNPQGLCLETQHYPDSPNEPSFPSTELKPGQKYKTSTVYKFTVKK